jgi:hypothetical protein
MGVERQVAPMPTENSTGPARRGFARWPLFLLAAFTILFLVALAAPFFLNVERYRTEISAALEKQTGRTVTLGKIQARVIPAIGVVVQDFHVGNPKEFPAGDLISADSIRTSLAIAPLLHGEIHVKSFELVHPKLTLLTDDQGRNNYTFSSTSTTPSAAAEKTGSPSSSMALDQIDNIILSKIEVTMGGVSKGTIVPSVTASGINITLHHFVVNPMTIRAWSAETNLTGVSLALGGWSAPIVFQSGQLMLSAGKLDAQFVAELAKAAEIRGTFSVPDVEKPQVNFEISSTKMDVDALIAGVGGSSTSTSTSAPPAKGPPGGPTPSEPDELVARGHINVETISSKPYTVGPATAEIRVFTDRAELWPITIGMYGGTLQVSSRVDRVSTPPLFSATVQMRGLDVAKVLEVIPGAKGKMTGTGELDLQILGSLTDDWKKTISGTGKFAVRNGALPGVNLSSAAGSIARLTGLREDTPFTVLNGDLDIANRRIASKQIHLDSSLGTVDLKGSVGMDETLDYQGVIALARGGTGTAGNVLGVVGALLGVKGGKISVPFGLGGTIESPKFDPGRGSASFPASSSPSASSTSTPAGQPPAPPNPGDTIKSLVNRP